ncbi:DUF4349 domain-containing protein [Streptomyces sp. PTD5-9]|uniref:DUF4349 domain-containing protein n=1 Tax=Streptomyces sp. PTD5-9 TaxID=3120150 RepID=UPI0030085CAF
MQTARPQHRSTARRARRRPASRPRRSRTALAAGLLAGLLALSGCGAGSGTSEKRAADSGNAAAAGQRGAADAPEGRAADGSGGSPADREKPAGLPAGAHVIRTATLSVEVRDVPKAAAAARAAAKAAGGLVADEQTERADRTHETSHIVLRVPQDAYETVLKDLAGTGRLLSRTSSAKDVTDQVVDVESRIASQRASVARVRKLMDRADALADVVTLEGELSSRQAALESLLAQQASLRDRTSLATVTLNLSEPAGAPEAKGGDDGPGFLDALRGGWRAFVSVLRWGAVVLGATAPFLASAAVLAVLARLVRDRLRRRRATRTPAPSRPAPRPPAS